MAGRLSSPTHEPAKEVGGNKPEITRSPPNYRLIGTNHISPIPTLSHNIQAKKNLHSAGFPTPKTKGLN